MSSGNKVSGILELMDNGHGFLRSAKKNFRPGPSDTFVPPQLIRKFQLKEGLLIEGMAGKPPASGKSAPLQKVTHCNNRPIKSYHPDNDLRNATSIDPESPLKMQMHDKDLTGMAIDLLTPIGKGQRGMIISPPKAGKTIILKHIAKAVLQNHPDMRVYVLLVDERPEEVTDFRRDLEGAMVFSSSSDQEVENHLRIISLTMNMAIREVELGSDVLVVMDSLTRMGRSYNKDTNSGGRTLSGGLAATALALPRKFFGAARNIEGGGSLTIMATILVDTGSRMDEVIFQEFKGTGNLDLVLSRECAERRIFPAIDVNASGTRKEDKLLSSEALQKNYRLRRKLANMKPTEAMPYVLEFLTAK